MNTYEVIHSRRSTRIFKSDAVPHEILEKIIDAGRFAPSGGNLQLTHLIVIRNKAVLDKLAELMRQELSKMEVVPGMYGGMVNAINICKRGGSYTFHYNAPVLVVACSKATHTNNMADCACANENMMLMATELGIGSVWINQLRWINENKVLRDYMGTLGMPEDERVYGAVALGYSDERELKRHQEPLERQGFPVDYVD